MLILLGQDGYAHARSMHRMVLVFLVNNPTRSALSLYAKPTPHKRAIHVKMISVVTKHNGY